jgi:hypothetical protein
VNPPCRGHDCPLCAWPGKQDVPAGWFCVNPECQVVIYTCQPGIKPGALALVDTVLRMRKEGLR